MHQRYVPSDRTVINRLKAGLYDRCSLKSGNTKADGNVLCILEQVDMVLIMSVNPGFGGQKFIPIHSAKIRELGICAMKGFATRIQWTENFTCQCKDVIPAGADVIVAGSTMFKVN